MKKSKSAFTIVELLIVIVIIGILAAITVVAYNGITTRANNTQRIAAAKQWIEAITEYTAVNQAYPASFSTYCIGESNITNFDANPDVDCGVSNNIKHDSSTQTPAFNSGIKTLRTSLPDFPGKAVQYSSLYQGSGLLFRSQDTYDPTGDNIANYPTLIFFLEGANQDCVLGPLTSNYGGGNFVKVTGKNSYSDIGTGCRVMLPDPNKL